MDDSKQEEPYSASAEQYRMRAEINNMMPLDKNRILAAYRRMKDITDKYGPHGRMALGLLGTELASDDEQ